MGELHGAFDSAGERARSLEGGHHAEDVVVRMASALAERYSMEKSRKIAFHLSDWHAEAAFLVAVHLCPDRFSDEEIEEGVEACVMHATHHMMAAAHNAGYPLQDVFELGLSIEPR
ncbi:MAG: hypothetical protein WD716_09775 [Fimbriimonadaceae bacterium]